MRWYVRLRTNQSSVDLRTLAGGREVVCFTSKLHLPEIAPDDECGYTKLLAVTLVMRRLIPHPTGSFSNSLLISCGRQPNYATFVRVDL